VREQQPLFGAGRMELDEAMDLTLASLRTYLEGREVVACTLSGGKDSGTVLTLLAWAILEDLVPAPKHLVVLFADTRMELPPVYEVVDDILGNLEAMRGFLDAVGTTLTIRRVVAPVDRRFFVQMFGRGIPPSHNKFRWCTPKLKVEPMAKALAELRDGGPKPLLLHGVRIGESAARDSRVALACSMEDSECGQGWYQQTLDDDVCDKLGPILHWRVCLVAHWLTHKAPLHDYGGWKTERLVMVYGGSEAMEHGARMGCAGCPLVTEDHALARVVVQPEWSYLMPLAGLHPLYRRLQSPTMRLRKPPGERTKTGALVKKQERLGPLTLEARTLGLDVVLGIQDAVNARAAELGRPLIDLLNAEEVARIVELQCQGEWPDGWDGDEPIGESTLTPLFQRPAEAR